MEIPDKNTKEFWILGFEYERVLKKWKYHFLKRNENPYIADIK